jgi:hypothetical protein
MFCVIFDLMQCERHANGTAFCEIKIAARSFFRILFVSSRIP